MMGDGGDWRFWAAAFFLYVATAVAWLWVVAVAQMGRPDLAAAVAVGWLAAVVTAIVFLVRQRRQAAPNP